MCNLDGNIILSRTKVILKKIIPEFANNNKYSNNTLFLKMFASTGEEVTKSNKYSPLTVKFKGRL